MKALSADIESIKEDEALAAAALAEADEITFREAAAEDDQLFEVNSGIGMARAVGFVRLAEPLPEFKRNELRGRRRTGSDRDLEQRTQCCKSGRFRAFPAIAQEYIMWTTGRPTEPCSAGYHEPAPDSRLAIPSHPGQLADDLGANPMQNKPSHQF